MRRFLIALISCYRYLLSPWLGQNCRFYPSCSGYAQQALQVHGTRKALWLILRRVSRCHPWHPGGYDPVPTGQLSTPAASNSDQHGNCSHG